LTSGHADAQGWASECPGVKKYKWLFNPVLYMMFYSCSLPMWQQWASTDYVAANSRTDFAAETMPRQRCADITFQYPYPIRIRIRMIAEKDIRICLPIFQ